MGRRPMAALMAAPLLCIAIAMAQQNEAAIQVLPVTAIEFVPKIEFNSPAYTTIDPTKSQAARDADDARSYYVVNDMQSVMAWISLSARAAGLSLTMEKPIMATSDSPAIAQYWEYANGSGFVFLYSQRPGGGAPSQNPTVLVVQRQ